MAISLAKEKWGKKNSNVYFDVEDKNEKKGIYTIVVRDSSTTVEMTTYKVDINKKTVTEWNYICTLNWLFLIKFWALKEGNVRKNENK